MTEPSAQLKTVIQSSLKLTEASLINLLHQFDNHDFGTLNFESELFIHSGFKDINQAPEALVNGLEVEDLSDFIKELQN